MSRLGPGGVWRKQKKGGDGEEEVKVLKCPWYLKCRGLCIMVLTGAGGAGVTVTFE